LFGATFDCNIAYLRFDESVEDAFALLVDEADAEEVFAVGGGGGVCESLGFAGEREDFAVVG